MGNAAVVVSHADEAAPYLIVIGYFADPLDQVELGCADGKRAERNAR